MKKSILTLVIVVLVVAGLLFLALHGIEGFIQSVSEGVVLGLDLVGGSEITYEAVIPTDFDTGTLPEGMEIAEGAAELLSRQFQREGIPGLQQNAFRLHQTLPDGAVCSLTEIASLRVLQVSAAGCKRDFDICQG